MRPDNTKIQNIEENSRIRTKLGHYTWTLELDLELNFKIGIGIWTWTLDLDFDCDNSRIRIKLVIPIISNSFIFHHSLSAFACKASIDYCEDNRGG